VFFIAEKYATSLNYFFQDQAGLLQVEQAKTKSGSFTAFRMTASFVHGSFLDIDFLHGNVFLDTWRKLLSVSERLMSDLTGEYQRDVVGLLVGTDPGVEGEHDLAGDHVKGLVPIAGDHLHHAVFAELAELVFRLGDTV
jgi:hypothetical protein